MSIISSRTNGRPWQTDTYKVIPFNFLPEITRTYKFRDPFIIRDNTPEKMDRMEGARLYSAEDYLEACQLLAEAGVRETKFLTFAYDGTPRGARIFEGLRAVAKAGVKIKCWGNDFFFAGWGGHYEGRWVNDQYKSTMDKLADHGAGGVDLVLHPPYIPTEHIWDSKKKKLNKEVLPEFAEALGHFPKAIEYAKKRGMSVVTPVHLKRIHPDDKDLSGLCSVLNYYVEHGVDGVNLSDANGACSPEGTRWIVGKVREQLVKDVPIYYHVHDPFGMATALAVAAAAAGGTPQPSINGIADRGFPCLAEVAATLEMVYGVKTGIDLRKMAKVSRSMQRITGVRMPPFKAVTGDLINLPYSPETQIAMLTQGKTWVEVDGPYDPASVGLRPDFGITYAALHRGVVKAIVQHMGAKDDDRTVDRVYNALKERLDSLGNRFPVVLHEGEVKAVCQEVLSS